MRGFPSGFMHIACSAHVEGFLLLSGLVLSVYSMAPADLVDPLIYDGFVEELVEVLEIKEALLNVGVVGGCHENGV